MARCIGTRCIKIPKHLGMRLRVEHRSGWLLGWGWEGGEARRCKEEESFLLPCHSPYIWVIPHQLLNECSH